MEVYDNNIYLLLNTVISYKQKKTHVHNGVFTFFFFVFSPYLYAANIESRGGVVCLVCVGFVYHRMCHTNRNSNAQLTSRLEADLVSIAVGASSLATRAEHDVDEALDVLVAAFAAAWGGGVCVCVCVRWQFGVVLMIDGAW